MNRTLPQVLAETAARFGDAVALRQPRPGAGGYETLSWKQYLAAATEIAAGLRALGLARGDVAALNSETRMEFYLANLGALTAGCIAMALYPSYPAPDLVRMMESAGAKAAFVEEPSQLEALRSAPVQHWILLTGRAEGAKTLDELRALGREALVRDPGLASKLNAETQPSDPAVLYLTSGATGEPKLALVTHHAIVSNIDMGPAVLPLGPHDASVAFLPSAHIAQRVVMEYLAIRCGMPVTFAASLLQLPQEIRQTRPTILLAPPRLWERIYSTICTEINKRPAAVRQAFYGALGMALAAANYRREGRSVPWRLRAPLKLADMILFRKVRARFGGRIRVAASGAAPLAKNLAEFYEAIGMPLVEGYGLTEGGVATLNPIDAPRPGSIGKPLPGVELRLSSEGELLIRGATLFSGYWNDPQATAEVLRDGWLHTGDFATIDPDGFVTITGRKKELIVSSTGKKIHPARVENLFKMEPLISQALLVGDGRPYLTALFTVNTATAEALKGMDEWKGKPGAEIAKAPPVFAEIRKAVARANRYLAPFEQVRRFRILPREFSIGEGELTATMKVRRSRALENFKAHIEELYAGRE